MSVRDVDAMVEFLQTAFPEWKVRGQGRTVDGESTWLHLGDNDTYIALSPATQEPCEDNRPYSGAPGVNHLAFVVENAIVLRKRLLESGYKESTPPNDHPHKIRVYFNDPDGNDWEFVQYYSEDPVERNGYYLPGR